MLNAHKGQFVVAGSSKNRLSVYFDTRADAPLVGTQKRNVYKTIIH